MKKFIKNGTVVLSTVLLSFIYSCEDDSINTNLEKTNDLMVTTEQSDFEVVQYDKLKISPNVSASIQDGRTYSYEWSAYPRNGAAADELVSISKSKDLDTAIELKVNDYYLVLTIKDSKTGVLQSQRYTLRVNSGFYEGWLVANNSSGKGKLSFIRVDGTVIENAMEEINGKTYDGLAMDAAAPIDELSGLQQIYYFTNKGAYLFDADTFAELGDATQVYSEPISSQGRVSVTVGGLGYNMNVVNNGKIHTTSLFYGFDGFYSPKIITSTYSNVFPFQFAINSGSGLGRTYLYDNTAKRFVYNSYADPTTISYAAATPTNAFFNMADAKGTMLAGAHGVGTTHYALMKVESAGTYHIYSLAASVPSGNKQLTLSGLDRVKGFDALSSGASLIYFAIDNKLYRYDFAANTAEQIYEFDAASTISDVKVYKNPYLYFSISPTAEMHNKRIAVAVNKGGAGEVFYFDLTGTGYISNSTYSAHFSGFGEITSLNYRNR
ncbi:PKD-like family lipoprotein [Flavobacterium notoginsengisoli]|uniref:PKD-like family lipoprotein n=1 Tax=Flavobacterium notoginsengisoli TaxID=1478199 RepID=UPI00362E1DBD